MKRLKSLVQAVLNTPLFRSLRFRLIGIVLLASLPTIALLFLTASQQRDDALAAGEDEAQRIAVLAASNQVREMERLQRELALLSRLPEVRGDDSSQCTEFFLTLVSDRANPMYVDLRVINRDGSVFCRSSVSNPLGQNENKDFIEAAIDENIFTVGRYRINPLDDRSIISLAAPVRDENGDVNRAIVATLDLGTQSSFITRMSLPEGAIISIVRDDGMLLFQQPVREELRVGQSLIGTPVVDYAIGPLATPVSGANAIFADYEGYLSAASPIRITGVESHGDEAFIMVELPEQEVVRRAEETFRDYLSKLGIAVAVGILAAWVGADLFVARDGETRKSIVAELYHAYSSGATEHLDSIVSPDLNDHSPASGQAEGLDGLKQNIASFRHAFPDGEVVPREMIADNDKVIARVALIGTQIGTFQGIPASGKRMIADGLETFQFREGVIAESWSLFGPLIEMQKLEAPEPVIEPIDDKPGVWKRMRGRVGGLFSRGRVGDP